MVIFTKTSHKTQNIMYLTAACLSIFWRQDIKKPRNSGAYKFWFQFIVCMA